MVGKEEARDLKYLLFGVIVGTGLSLPGNLVVGSFLRDLEGPATDFFILGTIIYVVIFIMAFAGFFYFEKKSR